MRSGNIPLTQWDHRHITVISIEIRVPVQQFSVSGPSPFAFSVVCPLVTEVQTHVGSVAFCLCVCVFWSLRAQSEVIGLGKANQNKAFRRGWGCLKPSFPTRSWGRGCGFAQGCANANAKDGAGSH